MLEIWKAELKELEEWRDNLLKVCKSLDEAIEEKRAELDKAAPALRLVKGARG